MTSRIGNALMLLGKRGGNMSFRAYPLRIQPSQNFWLSSDHGFHDHPFSSLVPRWGRQPAWNPFSDFDQIFALVNRGERLTPRKVGDKTIGHVSDENNFDLSGFEPKDIKVKTMGQKVVVEAKSEENEEKEGCHSFCHRQYHRTLTLPENVKPEDLKSSLSDKGVLSITAPLLEIEEPEVMEREIPIEREVQPAVEDTPEKKKEE